MHEQKDEMQMLLWPPSAWSLSTVGKGRARI